MTDNNPNIIEYYGYVLSQLQYEGSGIWSRFNIMIGINVSLFGLEALLYSTGNNQLWLLTLVIAIGGLLFSLWSVFVLKRLWAYHYHWVDVLRKIEMDLPEDYKRAFSSVPKTVKRKKYKLKTWLTTYTQPFFMILSIVWCSVILSNNNIYRSLSESLDGAVEDNSNNVENAIPESICHDSVAVPNQIIDIQ